MAIKSLTDINAAFDEGRWHLQRFQKNINLNHAHWMDATFASGQPPYDARVGMAGQFTPCVAQKNDAIWFPPIPSGMSRHLTSVLFWALQSANSGAPSVYGFDLLGYYPLLDGDSTDRQDMDNSLTLPRYASGDGVQMVVVNHIAPATGISATVINYTDQQDVPKTVTQRWDANGQNFVVSGLTPTQSPNGCPVVGALASGSTGVKRIDSIQHTTAPSGLHCIYLIKPLFTAVLGDNGVALEKEFVSKSGFSCPKIYDGAWLGWFERSTGASGRAVTWFGNFTFAWG